MKSLAPVILVIACSGWVAASFAAQPVRIALRPETKIASPVIKVSDVAELTGGDAELRERIGGLDLAETQKSGDQEQVSRAQLQIRLLLAGYGDGEFEVAGATMTNVTRSVAQPDAAGIVALVTDLLAAQLRVAPNDLEVRLAQPLPDRLIPDNLLPDQLRLEPRLPTVTQPGRILVTLVVYVDDQLVRTAPLSFDVAVYRDVAKTTRLVARGELFNEQNLTSERVRLTSVQSSLPALDVLGRQSTRSLAPGAIVQMSDVAAIKRESPILVRPRDVVRVDARKGSITVALTAAEALESGREGDVIRVRNSSSGKIITGRVVGRYELEMSL